MIFLILSVLLHLVLALGLFYYGPLAESLLNRISRENEPFVVDVIELGPGVPEKAPPKRPAFYAERNQSVEKETFPERARAPFARQAPAIVPRRPIKALPKPAERGHKDASKGAEEKEASKKKTSTPSGLTAATGDEGPGRIKEPDAIAAEKKSFEAGAGRAAPEEQVEQTDRAQPRERAKTPQRPSLFPTPERLAELEKRYAAEAPKGEKGKTLQLNTAELRYQKYLINMKNRIEFYWEYPDVAARNGWQGSLRIDFTISRDGRIGEIKVVKSSNYPVLDDAAVTAIRLANPFPPFPDNFDIEELNIRASFQYDIYRPNGR